jgi:hypothetical protein
MSKMSAWDKNALTADKLISGYPVTVNTAGSFSVIVEGDEKVTKFTVSQKFKGAQTLKLSIDGLAFQKGDGFCPDPQLLSVQYHVLSNSALAVHYSGTQLLRIVQEGRQNLGYPLFIQGQHTIGSTEEWLSEAMRGFAETLQRHTTLDTTFFRNGQTFCHGNRNPRPIQAVLERILQVPGGSAAITLRKGARTTDPSQSSQTHSPD